MDPNARGIAVLGIAVIVGLLLLLKAGGSGASKPSAATTGGGVTTTAPLSGASTTTTPAATSSTSTTVAGSAHKASAVKVLVLNGSGVKGAARSTSDTIGKQGYAMQTPGNATTQTATTAIYYAPGYQADAAAVATILGKSSGAVAAMPSTSPGPGAASAHVVVVVGKDVSGN